MIGHEVIIIGSHPIANDLIRQYEANGYTVKHQGELKAEGICINDYDELFVLTNGNEDDRAVALLGQLACAYDVEAHGNVRLKCHVLLQSIQTLRMLQTCDLCDAVRLKIDVYPFSTDEMWCRSIVLDYQPITIQSDKHVHLIIMGMNEIGEMVAIHAAHVAHYPNYVRNHSIRTRITLIDAEAERKYEDLIKRYQHLFDNCYYRVVKPKEEKAVVKFHKPMYENRREDFVDVEWEFVETEPWNVDLREKLQLWAADEKQLMTVVMVDKDGDKNVNEALHLPENLYRHQIPIYIYNQHQGMTSSLSYACPNIRCFGMIDNGYDVTLPLVRMAKNVNYIYDRCYEDNDSAWSGMLRYAVEIDQEERERSWARLSNIKRMSSIYNAMNIASKMRSIGLEKDEWDKFYDITQQDIELLAQVEHNRWSVEELILGFRPCTEEEQKRIETDIHLKKEYKNKKIHYDLRAYNDLRPDETGKPVAAYDLCLCSCLPLIAKAAADEEGGEA